MTETATIESFADVLESLGSVPLDRIRWRPYPGTATEADVEKALEAADKRLYELVDGVLIEKTMGYREAVLAARLTARLGTFVEQRRLGIVATADGAIRLRKGRVRIPDVAFSSWDRLPNDVLPAAAIPDIVPDLAIEVLSPSNTTKEMELKRIDYFTAGVRVVWEIDPEDGTVAVYTSLTDVVDLGKNDLLTGEPVLPGFVLPLAELFAPIGRPH